MPGKPYRSKLRPYEEELFALLKAGRSYRGVAEELNRKYGLGVTHNAVFSFAGARVARRPATLFYEGLSPEIRDEVVRQIAAVWTHDSTAIEGNTLTLGETVKVLELGLTINGKPLRDHQEVYGHARAIDLIYEMVRRPKITRDDLFALHCAVMDKSAIDVLHPVGAWKRDFNGTTGVVDGRSVYMEYAAPDDVPHLMDRWLKEFNRMLNVARVPAKAISCYVWAHMGFVRVHPFFDGNGRVARLIANLPVLRGGHPPVVVPRRRRGDYIDLLWEYQNAVGRLERGAPFVPDHPALAGLSALLQSEWKDTVCLVKEARRRQAQRSAVQTRHPRSQQLKPRGRRRVSAPGASKRGGQHP